MAKFKGTGIGELFSGTDQAEDIDGKGGNDTLFGALGNDKIKGGKMADTILGEDGEDNVKAGDGDDKKYKSKLNKLREDHGLLNRVHFVGHVSKQEMKWLYRNCEICILSSEIEACPNIAIEAMTSGCCLISSSHRPLPEIIGPDASIAYPSRDANAIAEAVMGLLNSPNEQEKLKQQATLRSQNYCWDRCAQHTYEFLRNQI